MLLRLCATLLICLTGADNARPDSWAPFSNQRVVSESGRRYVVIRKAKTGITYELCERAAGAVPMTPASVSWLDKNKTAIDRDPGDRLIVAGKVAQLPLSVLVPETLDGFLLFEKYANVGYGKTVIYIDGAGTEKLSLSLQKIFDGVPAKATYSVSSIWWNTGYWIDEARESIVVVARGDVLRAIAIGNGEITTPGTERLIEFSAAGTIASRSLALEMLSRRAPDGLDDATPVAMGIFHDTDAAMALRLRAAVLLSRAGSPVAANKLFASARANGQPEELRRYAVRNLPAVLGRKAMPVLRELMRGKAPPLWGECYHAFSTLGELAVPTLIEMLGEDDQSADYRGGAARALAEIKSPAALDALLEATATAEDYVANAACNAAIATGGEGLTKRLITILTVGSTQDGRIALYLQRHPTADALPAIDAALQRATDDTDRSWLRKARTACRR